MASPLISTQFSHMRHWSFVYLVHIGLLVITVTMQTITFKFQSQEGVYCFVPNSSMVVCAYDSPKLARLRSGCPRRRRSRFLCWSVTSGYSGCARYILWPCSPLYTLASRCLSEVCAHACLSSLDVMLMRPFRLDCDICY